MLPTHPLPMEVDPECHLSSDVGYHFFLELCWHSVCSSVFLFIWLSDFIPWLDLRLVLQVVLFLAFFFFLPWVGNTGSCCSFISSFASSCSPLKCLGGPCFQNLVLPIAFICYGTVLQSVWARTLLRLPLAPSMSSLVEQPCLCCSLEALSIAHLACWERKHRVW